MNMDMAVAHLYSYSRLIFKKFIEVDKWDKESNYKKE